MRSHYWQLATSLKSLEHDQVYSMVGLSLFPLLYLGGVTLELFQISGAVVCTSAPGNTAVSLSISTDYGPGSYWNSFRRRNTRQSLRPVSHCVEEIRPPTPRKSTETSGLELGEHRSSLFSSTHVHRQSHKY